ncbi:hypothetical protein Hanom_Chr13g01224441 [Helianthus anomalus]
MNILRIIAYFPLKLLSIAYLPKYKLKLHISPCSLKCLNFPLVVGNPGSKYSTHHSSVSSLSGDFMACVSGRQFHGRCPMIPFSTIYSNISVCRLLHSIGRRFLYLASYSILPGTISSQGRFNFSSSW